MESLVNGDYLFYKNGELQYWEPPEHGTGMFLFLERCP
jgi:hypothetical protein